MCKSFVLDERPRCVMAKVLDFSLEVNEFELQSRYFIHFQIYTLGKDMNPIIPSELVE